MLLGKCASLASQSQFQTFIDKLYTKRFNVYSKKPFGDVEGVHQYLAKYTHRIAISNRRLIAFNDKFVIETRRFGRLVLLLGAVIALGDGCGCDDKKDDEPKPCTIDRDNCPGNVTRRAGNRSRASVRYRWKTSTVLKAPVTPSADGLTPRNRCDRIMLMLNKPPRNLTDNARFRLAQKLPQPRPLTAGP